MSLASTRNAVSSTTTSNGTHPPWAFVKSSSAASLKYSLRRWRYRDRMRFAYIRQRSFVIGESVVDSTGWTVPTTVTRSPTAALEGSSGVHVAARTSGRSSTRKTSANTATVAIAPSSMASYAPSPHGRSIIVLSLHPHGKRTSTSTIVRPRRTDAGDAGVLGMVGRARELVGWGVWVFVGVPRDSADPVGMVGGGGCGGGAFAIQIYWRGLCTTGR